MFNLICKTNGGLNANTESCVYTPIKVSWKKKRTFTKVLWASELIIILNKTYKKKNPITGTHCLLIWLSALKLKGWHWESASRKEFSLIIFFFFWEFYCINKQGVLSSLFTSTYWIRMAGHNKMHLKDKSCEQPAGWIDGAQMWPRR